MSDLPERVNVMRVMTYDVANIVEQLRAERNSEVIYDKGGARPLSADEPFTIEDVLERLEGYIADDFSGINPNDLIVQDENGNEL
jgi:hypothetical protein